MKQVFFAILGLGAVAVLVAVIPDLKRYIKISTM